MEKSWVNLTGTGGTAGSGRKVSWAGGGETLTSTGGFRSLSGTSSSLYGSLKGKDGTSSRHPDAMLPYDTDRALMCRLQGKLYRGQRTTASFRTKLLEGRRYDIMRRDEFAVRPPRKTAPTREQWSDAMEWVAAARRVEAAGVESGRYKLLSRCRYDVGEVLNKTLAYSGGSLGRAARVTRRVQEEREEAPPPTPPNTARQGSPQVAREAALTMYPHRRPQTAGSLRTPDPTCLAAPGVTPSVVATHPAAAADALAVPPAAVTLKLPPNPRPAPVRRPPGPRLYLLQHPAASSASFSDSAVFPGRVTGRDRGMARQAGSPPKGWRQVFGPSCALKQAGATKDAVSNNRSFLHTWTMPAAGVTTDLAKAVPAG